MRRFACLLVLGFAGCSSSDPTLVPPSSGGAGGSNTDDMDAKSSCSCPETNDGPGFGTSLECYCEQNPCPTREEAEQMEAQRMCGDIEAFGWTAPLADGAWYEFRGGELVAATQWTDYPAYCGDWQMSFGSPTCQPEWPENGGYDGLGGFGGEGGDDQHVVK